VPRKQGVPPRPFGILGRAGESRFTVWMKRPGFGGGFRCNFRTYVKGGVWCVCETTDRGARDTAGDYRRKYHRKIDARPMAESAARPKRMSRPRSKDDE
jgi:hypothetical protein